MKEHLKIMILIVVAAIVGAVLIGLTNGDYDGSEEISIDEFTDGINDADTINDEFLTDEPVSTTVEDRAKSLVGFTFEGGYTTKVTQTQKTN